MSVCRECVHRRYGLAKPVGLDRLDFDICATRPIKLAKRDSVTGWTTDLDEGTSCRVINPAGECKSFEAKRSSLPVGGVWYLLAFGFAAALIIAYAVTWGLAGAQ